ncbi:MAG: hypothetical protein A2020_04015 [Lentisphaerae bacterium GWF2_45_14]|nr:MAG: hypothetical protein A2020_04015 [Lentisphaerae bacterium GWF2_45_14]
MYGGKANYRDYENMSAFVDLFGYGLGKVFLMTNTFRVNGDKLSCARAWNLFLTYTKKKSVRKRFGLPLDAEFQFIGIWEEHKKGGWHLHILGHIEGASTSRIRDMIRHFLSVTASNMGWIHIKWTDGRDSNGIKQYIMKYLTKEGRKPGIRYVTYSHNWIRRVKGAFSFVNGKAAVWRNACRELSYNFPRTFKMFYQDASFNRMREVIGAWQFSKYYHAACVLQEWCKMHPYFEELYKLDCRDSSPYWKARHEPYFKPNEKKYQPDFGFSDGIANPYLNAVCL